VLCLMLLKKAAFLHGVNRTTLMNRLKNSHTGPVGHQTLLTPNEEQERPAVADKPARRLRNDCTVYVRAVGL